MLSGLGLAEVARLAPPFFLVRQLVWLALSILTMLLVALVPRDLRWLRRYRYTWLLAGLALLATTLVAGVNPSGAGARLWLGVGGIYFQPSELLKLLLLVFLSSYLEERRETLLAVEARVGRWQVPHPAYLGPMLLMWGFSMLLLIWQRDLGAALLFFGVFLAMLYVATGQGRYILTGLVLLVGATIIGYRLFDHVALRVEAWWNPWEDASGRSFQIVQSLLAFASGGVLGQGLGQGLATAIPVVHTDFVFAAISEEYGLMGALAVIACFMLLVGRAFHVALSARRSFDQLLAAGIGAVLGLQSLVIMAGTLKLMPLTGVTLPLVSYGGSSLLTSMIMLGLLIHISGRDR
jgi:cell division protein FtsW (lipid II flippase)